MQVHSETLICDKKKTRHRFWALIIFSSLLGLLVAIAARSKSAAKSGVARAIPSGALAQAS